MNKAQTIERAELIAELNEFIETLGAAGAVRSVAMARKAINILEADALELIRLRDIARDAANAAKAAALSFVYPAPPAAGEQIDWQDMYLKQKSEKEAMAAKYERDIGTLARVAPAVTGERAKLITALRSRHLKIDTREAMLKAADMLEADATLADDLTIAYMAGVEAERKQALKAAGVQ